MLAELWEADLGALVQGVVLEGRLVDWDGTACAWVPGQAIVVDTVNLAARLSASLLKTHSGMRIDDEDVDWHVQASGRSSSAAGQRSGARVGRFLTLQGLSGSLPAAGLMRSTDRSWLFTMPTGPNSAVVLVVAPHAASLPANTDEVLEVLSAARLQERGEVEVSLGPVVQVAAQVGCLGLPELLLAGESAFAPDPLGGDGIGQALRSAILVQALIGAVVGGAPRHCCLQHYRRRIRCAYSAHLDGCIAQYERARAKTVWKHEIEMMRAAQSRMAPLTRGTWRYWLDGMDLTATP